ncbi:MAG: Gfo/Idh/MocA family oxidoreductase [Tyzzerella sp.]|nr:Gfo/Idh/MocA family oxidoreductase [Tyzzerella sp.]
MKKLRIALIGLSHVHIAQLTRDFLNYPEEVEVVGAADVPPYTVNESEIGNRMKFLAKREIPIWEDYKELLKQDIDIAIVCTVINSYPEIVEETMAMNIHTIVEKPMALTMENARRMYRAYKASKAQLIINWPVAWYPTFRKVKELVDAGVAGEVYRVQYRSPATYGPFSQKVMDPADLAQSWWYKSELGGGSLSDYAGYGCLLTTWISGQTAKRVSGFKKNFKNPFSDIEDYSVLSIDFGSCLGLVEGSWSTLSNGEIPTGPVVYGSKAVIVADRFDPAVKVYTDFIPYQPSPKPNVEYMTEECPDKLARNILDFIKEGAELCELVTPEFNMKVMAAYDAGIRSCASGQIETCADPFQF